jgi:hypothetical protein
MARLESAVLHSRVRSLGQSCHAHDLRETARLTQTCHPPGRTIADFRSYNFPSAMRLANSVLLHPGKTPNR